MYLVGYIWKLWRSCTKSVAIKYWSPIVKLPLMPTAVRITHKIWARGSDCMVWCWRSGFLWHHLRIILARGAVVSPHVELYFRETARIDDDPGRVIPTCQSEVAHTGESTIAAGGGSTEGLGSRKFRSATIKVKSFETKFIDCVDVFWVGEWLLICSVRSVKRDTTIDKYVQGILYDSSYKGWTLSHINAIISNEQQSYSIRHLKIYRGVSSELGRMDDDSRW